jgi:hypothetical protein
VVGGAEVVERIGHGVDDNQPVDAGLLSTAAGEKLGPETKPATEVVGSRPSMAGV